MSRSNAVTRRKFLGGAAALSAAGFAAPCLIPSGLLAAPGRPGPNDRIGIAGIGIGRQGGGVLKSALANVGRFVAVADVNLPRAQAIAKGRGDAYQDYRRVLDRKDVDAVVTATPDHWRALVCIHCCQAGKDVYAEKPLTLTIREGRLIVNAVKKYKRVLQTGSQQRSQAGSREAAEFVRNGGIGKVQRVIASNYPSPFECGLPSQPVPEGLDWDMWCGPTPLVPYHANLYEPRGKPGWISFRLYSGGEMTGWGSHGYDMVQWALGMDESGPIEIWVEGEKMASPTYKEPESKSRGDTLCSTPKVFFRYPGDIVMEPRTRPSFGATFIGEKGKHSAGRGGSGDHVGNWLDCVRTREQPAAHAEIGHRSATVCHLGNIARWLGRRLKWDPVKEIFPDDAEANTYLDRPRRKPYELPAEV